MGLTVLANLLTVLPYLNKLRCDHSVYDPLNKADTNHFLEKLEYIDIVSAKNTQR